MYITRRLILTVDLLLYHYFTEKTGAVYSYSFPYLVLGHCTSNVSYLECSRLQENKAILSFIYAKKYNIEFMNKNIRNNILFERSNIILPAIQFDYPKLAK